jgi:hypothetical protein
VCVFFRHSISDIKESGCSRRLSFSENMEELLFRCEISLSVSNAPAAVRARRNFIDSRFLPDTFLDNDRSLIHLIALVMFFKNFSSISAVFAGGSDA